VIGAAVSGARHVRAARNGQDAAATWVGDGVGAVVVCDGCGSGASSEVGARLGAQLVIGAIAAALQRGERPGELWTGVRAQVTAVLAQLVDAMTRAAPEARAAAIRDHFLFTVVAAVVAGGEASVWAIGDGAYAFSAPHRDPHRPEIAGGVPGAGRCGNAALGCGALHVLGPFADNQPPYLAYDLLGMPMTAHRDVRDVRDVRDGAITVATDGALELGLAALTDGTALAHPDGLRRRLAVLARGSERIDWDARRIIRTPAALQDDGAVAVLRWQREGQNESEPGGRSERPT
jgi:hypothetical protein